MSEMAKISLTHLHPIKREAQNNLQRWICVLKMDEKETELLKYIFKYLQQEKNTTLASFEISQL
jgi:hypothetical protein